MFTAVTLGTLTAASPGFAEDDLSYLTAGLLITVPLGGSLDQIGLGGGTSFTRYPDSSDLVDAGAFLPVQYLLGGGWYRVARVLTG